MIAADRRLAELRQLRKLRDQVRGMTEAQLVEALFRDPATGLLNRRAFMHSRTQMLAIVDLDGLKWLNDHDGHEAGDAQLRKLADELRAMFGEHRCYRLAGDEFVVRGDDGAQIIRALHEVRRRFPGFSFGVGRDLASADEALRFEKAQREQRGLRAPRGERPPQVAA